MRLTNVEKYAIQGMVADGKNAAFIAKAISKPESIVIDYVFKIAKSIVKVEEVKAANPPVEQVEEPTNEVQEPAIDHEANLKKHNFTQEDIKEVAIAGRKKANDYMISKTAGGTEGIKIMTGVSAALADERAKHYDTSKTRNQSAIFKPKGN